MHASISPSAGCKDHGNDTCHSRLALAGFSCFLLFVFPKWTAQGNIYYPLYLYTRFKSLVRKLEHMGHMYIHAQYMYAYIYMHTYIYIYIMRIYFNIYIYIYIYILAKFKRHALVGYEQSRRVDMTMGATARRQCADCLTAIARQHDDDVPTARLR